MSDDEVTTNGEFGLLGARSVNFLDPLPSALALADVARGLSRANRFAGQTRSPRGYTVAQHSVLMVYRARAERRWDALMHDATEAYTGDVVTPLKALLPEFAVIEHRLGSALGERFDVRCVDAEVKRLDREALVTERRDLQGRECTPTDSVVPWPVRIRAWSEGRARREFLALASVVAPTPEIREEARVALGFAWPLYQYYVIIQILFFREPT